MSKISEIKLPDFLLTNNPMAPYDGMDWIYCPKYLSLVLVVYQDDTTLLLNEDMRKKPRKTYTHGFEEFELIVIQNNVLQTGGALAPEITEAQFLDMVWKWYEDYLKWEDENLDDF